MKERINKVGDLNKTSVARRRDAFPRKAESPDADAETLAGNAPDVAQSASGGTHLIGFFVQDLCDALNSVIRAEVATVVAFNAVGKLSTADPGFSKFQMKLSTAHTRLVNRWKPKQIIEQILVAKIIIDDAAARVAFFTKGSKKAVQVLSEYPTANRSLLTIASDVRLVIGMHAMV